MANILFKMIVGVWFVGVLFCWFVGVLCFGFFVLKTPEIKKEKQNQREVGKTDHHIPCDVENRFFEFSMFLWLLGFGGFVFLFSFVLFVGRTTNIDHNRYPDFSIVSFVFLWLLLRDLGSMWNVDWNHSIDTTTNMAYNC